MLVTIVGRSVPDKRAYWLPTGAAMVSTLENGRRFWRPVEATGNVTARQAALLAGVNHVQVYRWIAAKKLPSYVDDGRTVIRLRDLRRLCNEREAREARKS